MKGLDLSKLKKVSSDKDSTTFSHADGHSVKVAHSGLSPKMRKEMEAIPIHAAEGTDTVPVPAEYVPGVSDPGPVATTGSNPNAPAADDTDNGDALANLQQTGGGAEMPGASNAPATVAPDSSTNINMPEQEVNDAAPDQNIPAPTPRFTNSSANFCDNKSTA